MVDLFTNQTADGSSAAHQWPGGRLDFVAWGKFDSGKVQLEMSPDGGSHWIGLGSGLKKNGIESFQLNQCPIRATLTGASSPSVSAQVR